MLFTLAACKGSENIIAPDEGGNGTPAEHIDPETGEVIEYINSDLAKNGVYDIADIGLGFENSGYSDNGSSYVTGAGNTDNGAFFVATQYDKYYNNAFYLFTLDDQGNLLNKSLLSKPVNNDTYEDEKTDVVIANEAGTGISYENVKDLFKDNKLTQYEGGEVYYEFFHYAGNGEYEAIMRVYTGEYEELSTEYAFNVRWNEDGECIDVLYIPIEYGDGYIDRYVYYPDGKLAVLYVNYSWDDGMYSEKAAVFSEDRFDNPADMLVYENNDLSTWLGSLGQIMTSGDKIMAVYASADNADKVSVAEIDPDTFEPVDAAFLKQLGAGSSYPLGITDDSRFVFSTNSGLQVCSSDVKAELFMDIINSDLRENGIGYFVSLNGTEEFYISYMNTKGEYKIAYCKHVAPEEVADCNVITFASNCLYSPMIDMIVDYNEKNTGNRVVFLDYQIYEKSDDYNADQTKLYEDMTNGRMADITFLDPYTNLDIDSLSRKGLLADIGALIDEDPDMSRDDYLTNVFDSVSYKGTLYRIVPYFSLYSAYGSREFFSDIDNWDVDTFLEYAESLDPEQSLMMSMFETRSEFISDMIKYDGYCWVRSDEYTCDFNDPSFMKLLGYAASLPEEVDFESIHMQNYWDGSDDMMATGEVRMYLNYMNIFKEGYYDAFVSCKGEPVFIGFPSPDSKGSVITYTPYYLLKADSLMLKESWDFIKQVLLSDYQNSQDHYSIPVLKSAFDSLMDQCDEPFNYTSEVNGSYSYIPTYIVDGESVEADLMTQEQIDEAKDFIYSIDRHAFEDPDITELIISEINHGLDMGNTPEQIASSVQIAVQGLLDQRKAG